MVKIVTKEEVKLPSNPDEIFKLRIDRDTQKFYIDGVEAYGKFDKVVLRPLDVLSKIKAYDDAFKVTSESTLYHTLKEARDTRGNAASDKEGKVCGRIIWNSLTKDMTEGQKEVNKSKAKFYLFVFAIAYIEGKEPILVDYQVGGSKFMEVANMLKKINDEKGSYHAGEITITLAPSDKFDWPEVEYTMNMSKELPVTGLEPLFDTVQGYVEYHNNGIDKKAKYNQSKSSNTGGFKRTTSFKKNS